jgi:hypothetical protein
VDSIYTDFPKAFDRVSHCLLLDKMSGYIEPARCGCVLTVCGFRDCLKIQSDMNRLIDWCGANPLELNIGKFKSIKFSRLRHPVEFSYMLGGYNPCC